jgi:hypothetical protein
MARQMPTSNRPAVLPDGSYASQTALADNFAGAAALGASAAPNLRTLLLAGDFFLGAVVAGAAPPRPLGCMVRVRDCSAFVWLSPAAPGARMRRS